MFVPPMMDISIHALREEGDAAQHEHEGQRGGFLSTPSARRATSAGAAVPAFFYISIHALREEGDLLQSGKMSQNQLFLSTPSARRATRPA